MTIKEFLKLENTSLKQIQPVLGKSCYKYDSTIKFHMFLLNNPAEHTHQKVLMISLALVKKVLEANDYNILSTIGSVEYSKDAGVYQLQLKPCFETATDAKALTEIW